MSADTHIFLSPHLDDAVLSCGGLIHQLAQSGAPATVITVMAGDVPPDAPMTPFIKEHFERWELYPDPVPGRKQEDQAALALLGATAQFGTVPDALYRTDGAGTPLYPDLDRLFGTVDPADPAWQQPDHLIQYLDPQTTIYAPLGAGHHVDHQIVRDIVVKWLLNHHPQVAIFFYEEYPYSANDTEAIIQAARAELPFTLQPVVRHINDQALAAKIEAIACYQSQISTFWDDLPAMTAATRRYARQIGDGVGAERLWLVA